LNPNHDNNLLIIAILIKSIKFSIDKTKLKESDRIFVVNNVNSTKKNRPMGKDVIIEIEILK